MNIWIAVPVLFIVGQFIFYIVATPEQNPHPIVPSRFDKVGAYGLYGFAYVLSLLRLPFAILPLGVKVFGVFVLKKHYKVSQYVMTFEMVRVLGEIINWGLVIFLLEQIGDIFPALKILVYATIIAETVRLFTEKGQMVFSVCWQFLPHRQIAIYLQRRLSEDKWEPPPNGWLFRYCRYYALDDEQRINYILSTLRCYAASDPETLTRLDYLSTLRICSSLNGMRGGHVRDVARGEVFIHRQWTSDPWLLIGQALRRTPWFFDPRFLRRPFYYRSESNRLATLFVLAHARYCPTYAVYQFGHEVKAARYDFFYRLLRWLGLDIEPRVQADGTFPFDQGISWLKMKLFGAQPAGQTPLWQDQDVVVDIKKRVACGEKLAAMDIAVGYTYPLKYVEEVLMDRISM